jgi:hypothetical protein
MTAFTDPLSIALSDASVPGYPRPMQSLYKSPIGTPVYSDLNIAAGSYMVNGNTVNYNSIQKPDALFVVRKRKRIIATSINGANGDIIEYTGEDSAEISCTVKFYGSNLSYPLNDMDNFYLMLESNQPIQINSWYLNQLQIHYAMITDYEIPQQTGNIGDQQIKFNMREIDTVTYPTLLNG